MSEQTPTSLPTQGRIKEHSLPSVLESLTRSRATGTLALSQDKLVKAIYLKDGEIVFATSTLREDRLGRTLVRHGVISESALSAVTQSMRETGKREGETLVEMGVLAPKALFEGLKLQVEEVIISLFLWDQGEYRFIAGPLPSQVIPLPIQIDKLLPKALQRLEHGEGG